MRELDLAYLAGIVDADGYVSVQKRRGRNGSTRFAARIGITGTRRQPHDLATKVFGGRPPRPTRPRKQHRVLYVWSRDGVPAVAVLEALRPFLRVKRRQAELALALQWIIQESGYECEDELSIIHQEVVDLNIWRRSGE